jgi:hypothetical protein
MVHNAEFIRSAQDLKFSNYRATIAVGSEDTVSPPSLVEQNFDFQIPNAFRTLDQVYNNPQSWVEMQVLLPKAKLEQNI